MKQIQINKQKHNKNKQLNKTTPNMGNIFFKSEKKRNKQQETQIKIKLRDIVWICQTTFNVREKT